MTVDRAGRQAVHWRGLTEDLNDVDEINATLARLAADGEHVVRIQLWLPGARDRVLDVPVERFVGSPPSKQQAMLRAGLPDAALN